MKTATLLFLFVFVGFIGQAQVPEALDENWYVDYIIVDGITHDSPIPGFPIINTNIAFFADYANAVLDPESDSFFADVSYDPALDEFTFTNMGITLPGCNNYCDFAPFYWDLLFDDGIQSHFTYQVSTNPDSSKGLQIIHDDGDVGFYNNFPPLGITENEINNISIYPNPVINELHISNKGANIVEITVFDMSGKKIFTPLEFTDKLDVSSLIEGVYFLKIKANSATVIRQFIKI